jgi:hypothetical protein
MEQIFQVAFIVVLPLVAVAGAVVTLFLVGALFDLLEYPDEARKRVEAIFRQPPSPARTTGVDHYYRPHWAEGRR